MSIDVGGTLTKSAVVNSDGVIVHELTEATASNVQASEVADHFGGLMRRLMVKAGIRAGDIMGACLGLPGIVEHRLGRALSCPNFRALEDIPLGDIVSARTGIKTFVEKDANLAALGESWLGAARNARFHVCLTLGTGIGAGIVSDGQLYRGSWGGAGEIGHLIVAREGPRCCCGNRGCLESLSSARAIAREGQAAAGREPKSLMWPLAGGEQSAITTETVFQAARDGDATAARVIDTAVEYLGIGIASIINVFNPDLVVLAGGMAAAGDQILEPVRSVVRQRARRPLAARVNIEIAQLGARAGAFGGAHLVFLST